VDSGSQQQWFSRNAEWGSWKGANWNMVFVGIVDPSPGRWPDPPYTVIDQTPLIREKPYLFMDEGGDYFVRVRGLNTNGTRGTTWTGRGASGASLPIDQFHLAHSERDNATRLNSALNSGKHLLLTPGIYHLEIRTSMDGSSTATSLLPWRVARRSAFLSAQIRAGLHAPPPGTAALA